MRTQLKKGVMELLVLALLRNQDRYGYEIVECISKYIEMSDGTIYPLLRRLQNDNLMETYLKESNTGPSRKYYRLTKEGISFYEEAKKEWNEFYTKVNEVLKDVEEDMKND